MQINLYDFADTSVFWIDDPKASWKGNKLPVIT